MPNVLIGISIFALSAVLLPGATVIYSNFGPAMSFTPYGWYITGSNPATPVGAGAPIQNQTVAMAFTSTGNYNLGDIQLALGLQSGTNLVNVYLESDSGGLPGAVLESMSLTGLTAFMYPGTGGGSVLGADSTTHPQLLAGDQYWVVVQAGASDTVAEWNEVDNGDRTTGTNQALNYHDSATGPWTASNQCCRSVFEVDAATSSPSVPEPSAAALLITGAILCCARTQSPCSPAAFARRSRRSRCTLPPNAGASENREFRSE